MGKGVRDLNREVQNPVVFCQIITKNPDTLQAERILEERSFSSKSVMAEFIEKRIRFYSSVLTFGVVSFRVYYFVRSNYRI